MKLKRKLYTIIIPLILLVAISSSNADQFHMKDGSIINGTIIKRTSEQLILRAEIVRNVYAEKKILKSNLVKIIKVDESIAAFQKISSIIPTSDLLTAEQYENLINNKIKPFIDKYKNSKHSPEAQEIYDILRDEQYVVRNGGVKFNNRMYKSEEIQANKYELEAAILFKKFSLYVRRNRYYSALKTLQILELDFSQSTQYKKAQKITLNFLPKYTKILQKGLKNVEMLNKKRDQLLFTMSNAQRERTKNLFKIEEDKYQNSLIRAKNTNNKWLPVNRYFKDAIEHNIKMSETESKHILSTLDKPIMNLAKYYKEAYRAIENLQYDVAIANLENFKKGKGPAKFISQLEPKIAKLKFDLEEMEKARLAKIRIAKEIEEDERRLREKIKRENAAKLLLAEQNREKGIKNNIKDKLNISKKHKLIETLAQ